MNWSTLTLSQRLATFGVVAALVAGTTLALAS
jgi:hypothetical protein